MILRQIRRGSKITLICLRFKIPTCLIPHIMPSKAKSLVIFALRRFKLWPNFERITPKMTLENFKVINTMYSQTYYILTPTPPHHGLNYVYLKTLCELRTNCEENMPNIGMYNINIDTFDVEHVQVILGSFGALFSKLQRNGQKLTHGHGFFYFESEWPQDPNGLPFRYAMRRFDLQSIVRGLDRPRVGGGGAPPRPRTARRRTARTRRDK